MRVEEQHFQIHKNLESSVRTEEPTLLNKGRKKIHPLVKRCIKMVAFR